VAGVSERGCEAAGSVLPNAALMAMEAAPATNRTDLFRKRRASRGCSHPTTNARGSF
jgi:hypothetical protein